MSSTANYPHVGEFTLCHPTLRVFAPTDLDDKEGQRLHEDINPVIEAMYEELKHTIEQAHSNVRVGFNV